MTENEPPPSYSDGPPPSYTAEPRRYTAPRNAVENIATFRRAKSGQTAFAIPEIPQNRKATDLTFIYCFGAFMAYCCCFIIYTIWFSDIYRFIYGYDACGNVCGLKNHEMNGISCTGEDMRKKPYLEYAIKNDDAAYNKNGSDGFEIIRDQCVSECKANYRKVFNRCFPEDSVELYSENSAKDLLSRTLNTVLECLGQLTGLIVIALATTLIIMALFRFFVDIIVWLIMVCSLLVFTALAIFFWIKNSTSYEGGSNLGLAIVLTIVSVLFAVFLVTLRKRINLIIIFFKQSMKIIFTIPAILFIPLFTLLAIVIALGMFLYLATLMQTSGLLRAVEEDLYEYVPNSLMLMTMYLNTVLIYWMCEFILGCQQLVIAGAISSTYFAKDKTNLVSSIYNSFYNLIWFHLGTVALGSLVLTIIYFLRVIFNFLTKSKYGRLFCCCLKPVQDLMKNLTELGYIETAIHGQPLIRSSLRGVNLIGANALTVIAINSVGTYVFFVAKAMILGITVGFGIWIHKSGVDDFWIIIVIAAVFAITIGIIFFALIQVALDTIFLCFCEDQCLNDGVDNPYATSVDFMGCIQEAQAIEKSEKVQPIT